jgi:DNA-binding transcriptional regulator YiaG
MTTDALRCRLTARRWVAERTGRAERQRCYITAHELAELLGVCATTVFNWERGRSSPRGDVAERWVKTIEELQQQLAA